MNIDAVLLMPDSNQVDISREKNMTSDNSIKLTVSFEVHTYYPAFRNTGDFNDVINPKRTRWYNNLIEGRRGSLPKNYYNDDADQINKQKK
jgi:hypothetical protein